MAELLSILFGAGEQLTLMQEVARAVLIFSYGLILLRLCGQRMFGQWSALDIILTIMIGSALARTMTGGAPLLGTLAAAGILAGLHTALGHCVARNRTMARLIEGAAIPIVQDGEIDQRIRKREMISDADLREALRQNGMDGAAGLHRVKLMMLEPSGKLSIVQREV